MRLWQDKKIKVRIKDVVTVQCPASKTLCVSPMRRIRHMDLQKVLMNAGIRYIFFVNLPGSEHNRLLIKEE